MICFLYSKKYIKIIYYNTLMNNEELIKENTILKEQNNLERPSYLCRKTSNQAVLTNCYKQNIHRE